MSSQNKDSSPEQEKTLQQKLLREQPGHNIVSCDVCMKEIPKSLAHTKEAEDYFLYFCGLDCYEKWEHQNQNNNNKPKTE